MSTSEVEPLSETQKICPSCKRSLPKSRFSKDPSSRDGLHGWCKECVSKYQKEHRPESSAREKKWRIATGRKRPIEEARDSSVWLGCFIAERALSGFFDDITRMPPNNPGYDFICGKGYKIEAKSSCLYHGPYGNPRWSFGIRKNRIAEYFLCLGFDDRSSLEPLHVWLIPGHIVNHLWGLSITTAPNSIQKWSRYEKPIGRVVKCCDRLKAEVINL